MERGVGLVLLLTLCVSPVGASAQKATAIPEDLRTTYGAFAAAMVDGDAERAIEFYAEDAVVLVDSEHVYRGRRAIQKGFLAEHLQDTSRAEHDGAGTEIGVARAVVGEGVVTLAGRYANPAGAAGVYSNTWERQDDGSWKLAASVMTFEATDGARAPGRASQRFSCTQVLGFSQSMEWYAGLSIADDRDAGTRPDLSALAPDAFLPGWQGRFFMGASVEKWTDPDFPGWSGAHRLAHETPAHCGRDEVDRVVFNVSGEARSPDAWAAAVDSVVDVIRAKFPAVREIVMQPVVGAPEGECTDVRAARNHPAVAEGVRRAADRGGVTAGPDPKVATCDQFSDALGHLTVEGAEHVRRALREHYRPSTGVPEEGRRSAHGSAPELLRRPHTSAETGKQREYLVYLPRGYRDAPRKDWPVILYLHGSGARGDGQGELDWVLTHGPLYEAWIQKRDLPFVIVAPQLPVFGQRQQIEGRAGREPPRRREHGTPPRYEICPRNAADCLVAPHQRAFRRARGGEAGLISRVGAEDHPRIRPFGMEFDYPPEGWPPDGWYRVEEDVITILDDVLDAFRTDPDRVYLTGVSYGGFGTFDLAASHPHRWAALAPVVGTGDLADVPVLAEAEIPIWMFGGGTDALVKPHWLYEMARALEDAGHPNVRLTVHEDMTHDAWRRVYAGRDLYDWLLSHRRGKGR